MDKDPTEPSEPVPPGSEPVPMEPPPTNPFPPKREPRIGPPIVDPVEEPGLVPRTLGLSP